MYDLEINMSKMIDLLNKVENKRKKMERRRERGKTFHIWIGGLAVTVMFFTVLGFNLRLFTIMKSYNTEKNEILAKLSKIEDSLNEGSQQITANAEMTKKFGDLLTDFDNKVKFANMKILEFEHGEDAQTFAIENLTKSKDMLFSRVSSLEAKLEKLESGK